MCAPIRGRFYEGELPSTRISEKVNPSIFENLEKDEICEDVMHAIRKRKFLLSNDMQFGFMNGIFII